MNKGPHIDSGLLARFLAGECNNSERAAIEQWTLADPAHAEELEALRTIWASSGDVLRADVDVDMAWNKLSARISNEERRSKVIPFAPSGTHLRWAAAAAVLVGVFIGVRYLIDTPGTEIIASSEQVNATLEDSSTVVVAPGSVVKVRYGNERHVDLSGRAYFEVQRDAQRPFIVETSDLAVTVLGTAFEVVAYDTNGTVDVRVRHGKVMVLAHKDSVILLAGDGLRYHKDTHFLERTTLPPVMRWGDRLIQFKEAPLAQVAAQLQELFKVRIVLATPALEHCVLTATFEDEPIDHILQVIADTFGFTLERTAIGSFTLNGDGC